MTTTTAMTPPPPPTAGASHGMDDTASGVGEGELVGGVSPVHGRIIYYS